MAEFNMDVIKSCLKNALNEPITEGKSIIEWAAIGMKAPRWVSVEDRLPEDTQNYIICILVGDGTKRVTTGTYNRQYKIWSDEFGYIWVPDRVIYWVPFPEPPEEVK